ncbi:N/A [soil metagenome]
MKPVVILLGKIPPPFMGPAIATEIILKSGLNDHFTLIHLDTRMNDDLRNIGKWSFAKISRSIQIYRELLSKIKKHDPALVLIPISQSTTGFIKDAIFIQFSRMMGKKVLLQLRGSDFKRWLETTSGINQWFVRRMLKSTQGMIVLGNNLKYLFEGFYPPQKILVVPNGGNYILPTRNRTEDNIIHLLYLGNLQASKGIEDVIKAASLLKKTHAGKFELSVIGGWRKEETKVKCLALVQEQNLPITFFPPEVSREKLQYLINADIFVFPPREPEGHPWVIVEAMACGLPIISTDQGAIIESVIHEQNGYIVKPANPQEIAEKMAVLIDNPQLRQRMAIASRKQYETNFTEAKMVEHMTTAFNTVINAK